LVAKKLIDLGDRVLSVDEWRGTGEISGVQASIPVTGVWTLAAGKITRIRFYFDHQEALEAVGLRE
jgi:ketosteroid isomerase-like protein